MLTLGIVASCSDKDNASSSNKQPTNKSTNSEEDPGVIIGKISQFNSPYTLLTFYRIAILCTNIDSRIINLRAISLICTHQNCIIKSKEGGKGHICPCHNSEFNEEGVPISGPAKTPLPWRKLSVSDDNLILYPHSNVGSKWKLTYIKN